MKPQLTESTVLMSLDLSVNSTGYAILTNFGATILSAGCITPETYPGWTKDRYPKSTLLKAKSVVEQLRPIILKYNPNYFVYEEINPGNSPSIMSTKSLSYLHCMVFLDNLTNIDKFFDIKTSQWRSAIGIKNARKKSDGSHKQEAIDFVNARYGTDFKLEDDDICEAIVS